MNEDTGACQIDTEYAEKNETGNTGTGELQIFGEFYC